MWSVVIAGVVGALLAKRGSPKVKVERSITVGSRSGCKWLTEYLPELDQMVIHGKQSKVVFQRSENGWKGTRAQGNQDEVALIRKDFERD